MIFTMTVRNMGCSETWEETYNKKTNDPNLYAQAIIAYFNDTLRRGELPRELVSVRVEKAKNLPSVVKDNKEEKLNDMRIFLDGWLRNGTVMASEKANVARIELILKENDFKELEPEEITSESIAYNAFDYFCSNMPKDIQIDCPLGDGIDEFTEVFITKSCEIAQKIIDKELNKGA